MNTKFEQDDSRTDAERKRKWRIFRAKHGKVLRLNAFNKQGVAFVLTLAVGIVGISAAWYTSRRLEEREPAPLQDVFQPPEITPQPMQEDALETFEESPYETDFGQPQMQEDLQELPAEATVTQQDMLDGLLPPVQGTIVGKFSIDALQYNDTLDQWCTHCGVDYAASEGTPVIAALEGTVESVNDDPLLGQVITLTHDCGIKTVYAGLGSVEETIAQGVHVFAGDVIATVGTSAAFEAHLGAHLHFELITADGYADPGI